MKKLILITLVTLGFLSACKQKSPPVREHIDPAFTRALSLLDRQNDSAFYYFNMAANRPGNRHQTAVAYYYMGFIQSAAGDYFGSEESFSQSLNYLDSVGYNGRKTLAADYNELGLVSISLKNYTQALGYFDLALHFSVAEDYRLVFLNNKALAYQKQRAYRPALALYDHILNQTRDSSAYARVMTNRAICGWLQQPAYLAAGELLRALAIRRRLKDQWGQNSSYAHLADYYARSRPDSALSYAHQMYELSMRLKSPDDRLEALQKLVVLSPAGVTKFYFNSYQRLNDSLQTARNAAKNQFALIRYESEKNKADKLKLQKDNTEKKYALIRQSIILYCSVFVFIILMVLITYGYRKRKQKALRDVQLRWSKKVHDGVANGLYRLMQEIDNQETFEKELAVRKLNLLYLRSRDISHEPSLIAEEDFTQLIGQIVTAFTGKDTKVAVMGNEEACWSGVSALIKQELSYILQEWMVNMKKHSGATSVAVRFERTFHQLTIHYTDNGVGFGEKPTFGKGLRNTGNRIEMLDGTLTFDTEWANGVKMHLTLPLA